MIIVNSVCGCAAGRARPGIAMALKNRTLPDRIVTVFAAPISKQPITHAAISRDIPLHRLVLDCFAMASSSTSSSAIRLKGAKHLKLLVN
jgi:hypothetical protein